MARRLTLRLSDELHERLRKASGSRTMTAFVIEAVAEKIGRAELVERVARLEERVEQLERQRVRS